MASLLNEETLYLIFQSKRKACVLANIFSAICDIVQQNCVMNTLYCNRLKRKFLIFYYIDNASCTVRCCVLL